VPYDTAMRAIPPLSAVRVFESAARHENFTKAAAELGMTQAAVSYQIKLLEERLKTRLFLRERGGLSLTDTGRRIAPLTSEAFDMLDRAFRIARAEDESVLTISTMQSLATNWLAPRIGVFQLSRPQLAVRIRTEDHYVDFAADDVDVAIRAALEPQRGLASHFLLRPAIQPVASPAFIAQHGPISSPADLLKLPRLSPDDVWWTRWFNGVGVADIKPAKPGIRLDSQLMEGTAALAGQGVAILNVALWRQEIDANRLVPIGRAVTGRRGFWLVYPEHRRNVPKIKAFREWLLAEFDAMKGSEPDELFDLPQATDDAASPAVLLD
jgi:LysR family transcriptional regulator, glycine cleavage system transcriptional activator